MIQDFKVRSILQAIWGLVTIDPIVKDRVFLAGAIAENGVLKTNGGRVLSVVGSDGKKATNTYHIRHINKINKSVCKSI